MELEREAERRNTAGLIIGPGITGQPDEQLVRIASGSGPYERDTGHEPSLLPTLARLTGPETVGPIVTAADVFGNEHGHPYAWPQIRESTMLILVGRFERNDILGWSRGEVTADEVDTWRLLSGETDGEQELRARLAASPEWASPSLLARLIARTGDGDEIAAFCAERAGRDLDACAVRALAEAATAAGTPIDPAWLEATASDDSDWFALGRAAHLLAVLPQHRRRALAERIVRRLGDTPPWFAALAASAVADDAPPDAAHELLTDDRYPSVWAALITELFSSARSPSADTDLARAHPFGRELADLGATGTVDPDTVSEMLGRWGGSPAMAAPDDGATAGDDGDEATAGDDGDDGDPSAGGDDTGEHPIDEVVDDRRLGIDVVARGTTVTRALIRDALTEIEVSIGPPGSAGTQLDRPAGIDFGDEQRRELRVRLFDDEGVQDGVLKVWRAPSSRASTTFDVVPRGEHYHATIVVYDEDGSTVIQAASFGARVVADAAAEAAADPSFRMVEVAAAALGTPAAGRVGSIVADEQRALVGSPGLAIHASPTGAIQGVAPLMATFRTAASNFVHTGGQFDITPTLIDAAHLGFRLRRSLELEPLDGLDRIQVVPLSRAAVLPLELVYDGEPPDDDATLCTDWTAADASGTCPTCTDLTDTTRVCPLRFWGLTKSIEHHYAGRAERDPAAPDAPFVAREHFRPDDHLPAPTHALIGVSDEVANALGLPPDDDAGDDHAERIEALTNVLHEVVQVVADLGQCDVADDWSDWEAAVLAGAPGLLIAMPHQEGDALTEASLELGGVAEATLLERHVRPPGTTPGPVVLLLGCDTSNAPNLLASFASDVRQYAPVVIATVGRVIAAEAPHVAATIVRHLHTEGSDGQAGIGRALVAARRALLAESRLVGLQLIAHGDARWTFDLAGAPTPPTSSTPTTTSAGGPT